jgi:hypothetical protein
MKKKPVHGIGVNDANYAVNPLIGGKRVMCEAYKAWMAMLRRCNCKILKEQHPTYIGVSVCDEWKSFMAFRGWWMDNHIEGWQLDKDILTDNREYSPESCIYVPSWLNNFIIDSGRRRGDYPIGVSYSQLDGTFHASCRNPKEKASSWIGRFRTPEEAHLAWRSRKLGYAALMKSDMDAIDLRIYHRIVEIINRAR